MNIKYTEIIKTIAYKNGDNIPTSETIITSQRQSYITNFNEYAEILNRNNKEINIKTPINANSPYFTRTEKKIYDISDLLKALIYLISNNKIPTGLTNELRIPESEE